MKKLGTREGSEFLYFYQFKNIFLMVLCAILLRLSFAKTFISRDKAFCFDIRGRSYNPRRAF